MGRYSRFFGIDSDYELEAYEQHYNDDGYCEGGSYDHFIKDKNYYHGWYTYYSINAETEKRFLVQFYKDSNKVLSCLWIPKKIIRETRELEGNVKQMLIHKEIFGKIKQLLLECIEDWYGDLSKLVPQNTETNIINELELLIKKYSPVKND